MTFIVHASMYNIVLNMVGQIESNTIICPACLALYAAVLEYDYISAKYSWNSSSTDYSYNKVSLIFEFNTSVQFHTRLKVWGWPSNSRGNQPSNKQTIFHIKNITTSCEEQGTMRYCEGFLQSKLLIVGRVGIKNTARRVAEKFVILQAGLTGTWPGVHSARQLMPQVRPLTTNSP